VGEDPGELAHLTRRLYCDPDLWTDVSAALLDRAGAFGLASFRSRLAEAMVQFGLAPPERQPGRRRLSSAMRS